jgi:formylglycine-generating enzyme required for sulfatase activity
MGWRSESPAVLQPTEVQWEYAARAGTRTAYWWGDEFDETKANADSKGDKPDDGSKGATTPVKRYPPNPWGLYDVHGNVWEWCDDVWRDRLDGEGGEADPSQRAVRGGSWFNHPDFARSAYRRRRHRDYRGLNLGFRLSLRSQGPGPEALGAR